MFPFVLLLHAWWRRGRVARTDLRAVAPFLAVSLILGMVTLWFQETVAIRGIVVPQGGFLSRTAVAGLAIADAGIAIGQNYISSKIGQDLIFDMRTKIFAQVQK